MKWFRKSEPVDPLEKAKTRDELLDRLRDKGFFIRRQTIRRPKVGDTVRFYVSAGWKINTHYYQTGTVVGFTEFGQVEVEKRNKQGALVSSHTVHPLEVVRVTKPRQTTTI